MTEIWYTLVWVIPTRVKHLVYYKLAWSKAYFYPFIKIIWIVRKLWPHRWSSVGSCRLKPEKVHYFVSIGKDDASTNEKINHQNHRQISHIFFILSIESLLLISFACIPKTLKWLLCWVSSKMFWWLMFLLPACWVLLLFLLCFGFNEVSVSLKNKKLIKKNIKIEIVFASNRRLF